VTTAAARLVTFAAEAAPTGVDLGPIVNVGAFGVLSLLLLGFSLTVYKREVKRADAAETALRALQEKVIDLYVPAVTEATRVVGEFLDAARRDRR
jgi:hypothetical protein